MQNYFFYNAADTNSRGLYRRIKILIYITNDMFRELLMQALRLWEPAPMAERSEA